MKTLHSPKARFSMNLSAKMMKPNGEIYWQGLGYFNSDDVEELRNMAITQSKVQHTTLHVILRENKSTYPKFNWEIIDTYDIEL